LYYNKYLFLKCKQYLTNAVVLVGAAVVPIFVEGGKNPIVVVVVAAAGTVIVGALDIFVAIGNAVVEIGAARRLESVLLADEVEAAVVATGRKLFAPGANDAVVAAVGGLNAKGVVDVAFVAVAVVVAIVVAGGTNEKAGVAILKATGAAVFVDVGSENDGPG
jgi:hypothetical protein